MASYLVDDDLLLHLAAEKSLDSQFKIAKAAGVNEKTVWNALHRRKVSLASLKKLAVSVGLDDSYCKLIVSKQPGGHVSSTDIDSGGDPEQTSTVLRDTFLHGFDPQDIKLVLISTRTSRLLLARRKMPSFAHTLRNTKVCTPIDDSHKDHPVRAGTQYNHFVQPAIVVTLDLHDEPNVLAYARLKRPRYPSNVHTGGMSILFGSSPLWNVVRLGKTALDQWLESTGDPTDAKTQLLVGDRAAILQFVQYKINLLERDCRIQPLGVITKDERRLGHNRVYTQFVFHVRLPVTDRNIDRFVRQISTGGTTLYRLSARDDPEGLFRGQDGKVNTMDIVAWRALHRRRKREDHGAASFWRDFLIV